MNYRIEKWKECYCMKMYTNVEAAQYLGVTLRTIENRLIYKTLVPDVIRNGNKLYSEELLIRTKESDSYKNQDRKLVILILNQKTSDFYSHELISSYISKPGDDKYEFMTFNGVPEDELLGNEDFMKLIEELSSRHIYRLVVYNNEYKKDSLIFNLLKTICNGARISFKTIGELNT
jgi:hypothetical protein